MVSQHFKIEMVGESIAVGVIGATGKTGQSVVDGLLSSDLNFVSLIHTAHLDSRLDIQHTGCYLLHSKIIGW